MMNRLKSTACISLLLIAALSGCKDASQPTAVTSAPNLSMMNVMYHPDQTFTLELDLHFDSGYTWSCEFNNPGIIRIDSIASRPKGEWANGMPPVGGASVQTYYFHALKTGQCIVSLKESQEWLKDAPPLNQVQLNVTVY
jgi:predicted secreted protein